MSKNVIQGFFMPALCAGLLLLGPALAQAEESSADSGWDFAVAAYMWGADIGGSTGSGADIDVSFSDLFSGLNAGFMGTFEARKDKWLVLTDLVYLDVSADSTTNVTIPVGPGYSAASMQDSWAPSRRARTSGWCSQTWSTSMSLLTTRPR